ncbi:MAG: M18 family aminopeptidase [Bacilli bacterium]|nr:M18 family aminopeptidase [Bacilli bacterium]
MIKKTFNNNLFEFIKNATCSFTCIEIIKNKLFNNGYSELYENEKWEFKAGKYFVVRNDASIIAFTIGKKHSESFNIICAHSDTPGFSLKPKNEIYEYNYLKLNVMPYGGILNYGFMDRPLGIAGRVIYKQGNKYKKEIIDLNEPICVIPSEAIHQNDSANTNLDLNTQIDLIPIIGLSDEKDIVKNIIRKHLNLNPSSTICDYDLFLYCKDKPIYIGTNNELILSPRIDDLSCTFATLESFIESDNSDNINIMCIFNSEEIGSLTKEGADSSFLMDTLKRISAAVNFDISIALHNSLIISADNSHAVHPNHPNKSDVTNQGFLNDGILIIREKDTTTDSISSSIFKEICKKAKVPFQDYVSRNDMTTGSTLSGLSIRHVSIDSIDVGLPQLAMHSANELMGSDDTYYLYKAFKKFYDILIKNDNASITLKDCKK